MMLFPLIKKDIMLVKGYSLGVIAIAVGLPLLLAWRQPQIGVWISFLMAVLISSVAFNLAISEKENQYPKATALLSSTPYMKNKIVGAKYSLYLIIYLVCCIASFVEMQFIPELSVPDFARTAAVVFLIQAIGMGIFLPIQYKLGYEKTKFICFLLFLSPIAINATEHVKFPAAIARYFNFSPAVLTLTFFMLGIAVWFVSFLLSKKVFRRKDLI